eukprot:COSAG06_NODE_943_length_11375_cov_11.840635_5_plen_284_part_00
MPTGDLARREGVLWRAMLNQAVVVSLCLAASQAALAGAQESKAAVAARDAAFAAAYNSGDYRAVQEMYAPHAILIPPPSVSWVINNGTAIADFFKQSASEGIKEVKLTPLFVKMEADPDTGEVATTHEIGNVTSSANPFGNMYYTRWERNGSKWQITTDCMAVGKWWSDAGPKPNPPPTVRGSVANFVELQTNALNKLVQENTTGSLLKYVDAFEPGVVVVPPIPGFAGCPLGVPPCSKTTGTPTAPCCPPAINPLAAFVTKPELFVAVVRFCKTARFIGQCC